MPWEHRGDCKYYYRNERSRGKVARRYVGNGPGAELVAAADDLRRLEREVARREHQEQESRYQVALEPLLALIAMTDQLSRAALVAAGYYRHDRGNWRPYRGKLEEG